MNAYLRSLFIALLFALLFSSCGVSSAKQTQEVIYSQAVFAMDTSRAVRLENGASYDDITPDVIAISAVITAQKGAYMLINDCQQLAVFLTPAGKGSEYYLYAFVDISKSALLSADRMLVEFGIDAKKLTTIEDLTSALKARGFEPLAPAVVPTLASTLRIGLGFLRSLGGTISDMLVVPAIMLTPDLLYPWCHNNDNCVTLQR